MAHDCRNGIHDSFHSFFECWIVEQNQHLGELVSALKDYEEGQDDGSLRPLLARVVHHYEHYYKAKSRWAGDDILTMFKPPWRSNLENAFLWVGGWRPSAAFHLLYSKSGLQFEAGLEDLMVGKSTKDLGDLSARQMEMMDKLQRETIREEKLINEKLAKQQETVADSGMVELSQMGEMERNEGQVEVALALKEEGLVEVLQRADDLRLKTLKEMLDVLTPIQSVHFLIAAAELHLRVHEWGGQRDEMNR